MNRKEYNKLVQWKNADTRKPLIIQGARQVGKTWLMRSFGEQEYDTVAYVNFESAGRLSDLFKNDFNVDRIILALEIETGVKIQADRTLIILDEIQEAPQGLTSLKYFYENAPEYHVLAAGSLLGIALNKVTSFPVGKVEFLNLYPLTYQEFLEANGESQLIDLLSSGDWSLIETFKDKYIEYLRYYYYVGGMPEAVLSFVDNRDLKMVRTIQKNIISGYEQDFSKHAPNEIVPRIRMLWNAVLSQLSKENRKFIYSAIRSGARAKDYELALAWLIDAGLICKVPRIVRPVVPLKAYEDLKAFKLYLLDVGLLGAMGDLESGVLLSSNQIMREFKGALTEQYVFQQLTSMHGTTSYYWSADRGTSEIDFVIQKNNCIVPMEVKSEENLQSKSLKTFYQKFHLDLSIRLSMSNFRNDIWLVNIPLYAISGMLDIIESKT